MVKELKEALDSLRAEWNTLTNERRLDDASISDHQAGFNSGQQAGFNSGQQAGSISDQYAGLSMTTGQVLSLARD